MLHLYKDKSQALHTGCHLNRIKNTIRLNEPEKLKNFNQEITNCKLIKNFKLQTTKSMIKTIFVKHKHEHFLSSFYHAIKQLNLVYLCSKMQEQVFGMAENM